MIRCAGSGTVLQFPFLKLLLFCAFVVKDYMHWAIRSGFRCCKALSGLWDAIYLLNGDVQ